MFAIVSASLALTASLLTLPVLPPPAVGQDAPPIPNISADRWIVYDADAEVVLASWNANDRAAMASVTKVMTAIVTVENADLDEVVTVPRLATAARGSVAGLVAGEKWTVGDLLIAMMVRSGNDAALALAYHVGGDSVSNFVAMMNDKASEFGMSDTSFANPNGLDHEQHYSTANDLLTLIIESQNYPDVQRVGRIKKVNMPADPNGKTRTFNNTNKLLGAYPGVVGLKTGDTPWADKVLLGVTEQAGRTIYSVVMHSDDHFSDTREIVDWAYDTFTLKDRWMRAFYAEDGGGSTSEPPEELSESHERRLRAMLVLDDGRWNTSSLLDLPKAESIGRWIREAIPSLSGDG
jgi:D-alanyl-D-alanine carboxypeptidase